MKLGASLPGAASRRRGYGAPRLQNFSRYCGKMQLEYQSATHYLPPGYLVMPVITLTMNLLSVWSFVALAAMVVVVREE